ncbi:hypothetical protein [Thermococcus sp.]|uniref:hypothetical protein n=1 Tax=Thermococcus sp. TaxID=35749 RepID=UPI0025F108AB|nr:hypothetical protein [Thermococcus sp.]
MFNVTKGARGNKGLTAMVFAFSVVAVVFIGFVVATGSTATYYLSVSPSSPEYVSIGGGFLTVSLDVSSSEPVTVCITDSTGLSRLESGKGALCYLYAQDVTSVKKLWRSPTNGQFYLVIMSEKPTKAKVTIKSGFLVK